MASLLSWFALGLGLLGLGYPLAQTLRTRSAGSSPTPFLLAAGVLLVLGVLITLPAQPPWSGGQTLGVGFLLGGVAVLLPAILHRAAPEEETPLAERWRWLMAAECFAAPVMAVALVLALYPKQVMDPLAGLGMGAVLAGVLVGGGLRLHAGDAADTTAIADRSRSSAAELSATVSVVLASATYLGAYHLAPDGARSWQPLPALLGGVLSLALTARGLLAATSLPAAARSLIALALPLAAVAAIFAFRLDATRGFLVSALTGLAVYGLIAWLERPREEGSLVGRMETGLLSGLLVLGGSILAFRELHGFGIGVMTLAGLALASAGYLGEGGSLLRGGVAVGALLTLLRVYLEHRGLGERWEPDFHYYAVGLLLGAALPLFLAGSITRWMPTSAAAPQGRALSALLRVGLAGAAATLFPLIFWLGVGDRPQTAIVVGLALGAALYLTRETAETGSASRLAHLLAYGAVLTATQLTFLLEPLTLRTRTERIGLLAVLGVIALVWIAVTAFRERGATRAGARGLSG